MEIASNIINNLEAWMENLSPFMSFVVILWLCTILLFRKTIAEKIKATEWKKIFSFRKRSKELKKIHLLKDHDLFNVIERVKNQLKLKRFYTDGEVDVTKTKMFNDFMGFYLNRTREEYKEFFTDDTLSNQNTDELKGTFLTLLNKSRRESADETVKYFRGKGISEDDTEYIIRLFEQWRQDTYTAVNSRIDGIFSSDFHFDNFEKLLACLEIISMSIDLIPKDGVESFEKLNGRFKNLKY